MKNNKDYKWMYIIKGIVFIIAAFLILRNPLVSLMSLTFTLGIMIVFTGGLFVTGSILTRKFNSKWEWIFAFGILDVILGALLLVFPELSALLLVAFIGSWTIFVGVLESIFSFQVKKLGIKTWWQLLVAGILSIVLGIIILFKPLIGALSITLFIGFQFLLYGISLLIRTFQKQTVVVPQQVLE